jgi:hypothetical protein
MGMFDSLRIKCKNCGNDLELQSKAGECVLRDYDIHSCPANIAMDLSGESKECENCGTITTFRASTLTPKWIE